MAKLSTDELLDAFKEMTLLDLSDFVKQFEETFDVKAAAPVAVAQAAAPGGAGPAEEVEEKDEFDVILEAAGDKKIQVIKEVRSLTSLGLKEAKDLVDGAPNPVLEHGNKEQADKAKAGGGGRGGAVHGQAARPAPAGARPGSRRWPGTPPLRSHPPLAGVISGELIVLPRRDTAHTKRVVWRSSRYSDGLTGPCGL